MDRDVRYEVWGCIEHQVWDCICAGQVRDQLREHVWRRVVDRVHHRVQTCVLTRVHIRVCREVWNWDDNTHRECAFRLRRPAATERR